MLFVTVKLLKYLEVCCHTALNAFSMHLSGDGGKSWGGGEPAGENVVIMTSSGG